MFVILRALGMFVADLFKSRSRLERIVPVPVEIGAAGAVG
jgi:hypothetical protein